MTEHGDISKKVSSKKSTQFKMLQSNKVEKNGEIPRKASTQNVKTDLESMWKFNQNKSTETFNFHCINKYFLFVLNSRFSLQYSPASFWADVTHTGDSFCFCIWHIWNPLPSSKIMENAARINYTWAESVCSMVCEVLWFLSISFFVII